MIFFKKLYKNHASYILHSAFFHIFAPKYYTLYFFYK